jgi:glycosyltransferase involved in cell wall biosynthesis
VCIGVRGPLDRERLRPTLASLRAHTVARADLVLLGDDSQEQTAGEAACLKRLAVSSEARALVLLESGALVGPGWLSYLLAALDDDPRNGIAGPSTNHSANEQAIFRRCAGTEEDIAVAAARAARRFGASASPLRGLETFCYAVRRDVVEAVAAADETDDLVPDLEGDYEARARAIGFRAVWARGAFVYRAPPAARALGVRAGRGLAARSLHDDVPLVTCIMPTRNRPEFALRAVRYFQRQTYPARELVIVDDGEAGLGARLPDDPRVRYIRSPAPESIGAKRNRACGLALGTVVAHWDDDDWYGPRRLAEQVAPLLAGEADITGLQGTCFFDLRSWHLWSCSPGLHQRLFVGDVHGGTLVYDRRVWEQLARYPNSSLGEDAAFLKHALRRGSRLVRLSGEGLFLYVRHSENSWSLECGADLDPGGWVAMGRPRLTSGDRAFYAARSPAATGRGHRRGRPLVSCIMPTADRRAFVSQAIRYFLRQDYPNRELIVLDDGRDRIEDLIPPDPRVRYVALEHRLVLGEKRNLACELARGAIVVHWDDDDWIAPDRLSYQVSELEKHEADVCGTRRELYYDVVRGQAWLFEYPPNLRRRLTGNTLCYRKTLWARRPFAAVAVGEDTRFVRGPHARNAVALADHRFCVGFMHEDNASPKLTSEPGWRSRPVHEVRGLLGHDLAFYDALTKPAARG